MHSTVNGADAIIALRCREASATWEVICNSPRTQGTHRLTSATTMISGTCKIGVRPSSGPRPGRRPLALTSP